MARHTPTLSHQAGFSSTASSGEKKVNLPKDLVPSFVVGDNIDNWFKAYEVALSMHRVPKEDWG